MGRVLDGGVQHAVDADVDAVDRPAGGLVAHVEAGHRLADVAESLWILERDVVTGLKRQRGRRELAVAQGAPGGHVDHAPVLGGQGILRHLEARGGGAQQHLAGGGAEPAHGLEAGAGGEGAAGHAQAVHHRVIRPRRGAFHREAGRVEVELLADGLGKPRVDALPALHEGAEQADRVVGPDLQEGGHARAGLRGDRGRALRPGLSGGRREPQTDAEEERAGGRAEEAAAGEVADRLAVALAGPEDGREVVHGILPQAAACRTAAAMAL
ncbi:hypothetical protein AEGHOMDF_5893 [Methylobacterium soli]|nr:hypothetical protein AEGHOMDF_5893 [Methylobacterium soli]